MSAIKNILNRVDLLMNQMEEVFEQLRSQNEELARNVKKTLAREAVARALNESVFYAYGIEEVFDASVRLLSKLEYFDLVFFLCLDRFRESLKIEELYISDPFHREFALAVISYLWDDPNFLKRGFEIRKDFLRDTEYRSFVGVPFGTEDFTGLIGVFSKYERFPDDQDLSFLEDLSKGLSVGVRQELLLIRLREQAQKLKESLDNSISLVEKIIELKDPYGRTHGENVADLAFLIGKKLGLSEERLEFLRLAAKIHDIGKVGLPVEILNKPAKLTELEHEVIRLHPGIAYDFLRDLSFPLPIAEIIFQHHERLDGSGYPRGLKGEEIMLEARILSVAEVVESMSHFRVWRDAFPIADVLNYIKSNRGVLFDPKVVDACVSVFEEGFKFRS
ncbi:MAG: HD-GYP domain-containing protein [candidate division WOR-3 bacterium]